MATALIRVLGRLGRRLRFDPGFDLLDNCFRRVAGKAQRCAEPGDGNRFGGGVRIRDDYPSCPEVQAVTGKGSSGFSTPEHVPESGPSGCRQRTGEVDERWGVRRHASRRKWEQRWETLGPKMQNVRKRSMKDLRYPVWEEIAPLWEESTHGDGCFCEGASMLCKTRTERASVFCGRSLDVQPQGTLAEGYATGQHAIAAAAYSSMRAPSCCDDSMMARTIRMSARPSSPGTIGSLSSLMARASSSICRAC